MARGYLLDPATGLPAVQTASGDLLPLPLSQDDMTRAGAALAPPPGVSAPAPPTPPDLRVAGPGGGAYADDSFNQPPDLGTLNSNDQAQRIAATRAALMPQAGGNAHASAPSGPAWMPRGDTPSRDPGGVDPTTLAQPRGAASPAGTGGEPGAGGMDDPLVRQAMAEAMRGGGGGGPRGLGVTGQTRKYKVAGEVPADVAARTTEALGASDAYNEQLAMSLDRRQGEAYQAQQAEYQGRVQAVAEQRAREQEQQRQLQDFESKWDAQSAETAQMKVPQMEDYWQDKGTMATMATALSITLGGALQGLRGGQNPGLEMSNQAIERWVSARREEYQRARDQNTDMGNQYARMVQSYGSQNLAEQRLRDQAYGVRDAMMQAYAQKIGTPGALEAYNQAQLQSEAQRAALQQQAYQDAGAEIEEKLTMQGGGGGGGSSVLKMLRAGAEAKQLRDKIEGNQRADPTRGIEGEKTDAINASLNTIHAADEIARTVGDMGYGEDDTDDPRAGALDYVTKNLPGTNSRKLGQNLDQATNTLARGIQQGLGKSDNDAKLADQMAIGGGSGRERITAAQRAKSQAIAKLKVELSGVTPQQRDAFIQQLPPDVRQQVSGAFNTNTAPARSEERVR